MMILSVFKTYVHYDHFQFASKTTFQCMPYIYTNITLEFGMQHSIMRLYIITLIRYVLLKTDLDYNNVDNSQILGKHMHKL